MNNHSTIDEMGGRWRGEAFRWFKNFFRYTVEIELFFFVSRRPNDNTARGKPRIPYTAGRLVGVIRRPVRWTPGPCDLLVRLPRTRKMPTGTGFPFGWVFYHWSRLLRICTQTAVRSFSIFLRLTATTASLPFSKVPSRSASSERASQRGKVTDGTRTRNGAKNYGQRRRYWSASKNGKIKTNDSWLGDLFLAQLYPAEPNYDGRCHGASK